MGKLEGRVAVITGGANGLGKSVLNIPSGKAPAVWLAGDDAGFVNGHILVIDGGLTGGRSWSEERKAEQRLREALGVKNTETMNTEEAVRRLIRP